KKSQIGSGEPSWPSIGRIGKRLHVPNADSLIAAGGGEAGGGGGEWHGGDGGGMRPEGGYLPSRFQVPNDDGSVGATGCKASAVRTERRAPDRICSCAHRNQLSAGPTIVKFDGVRVPFALATPHGEPTSIRTEHQKGGILGGKFQTWRARSRCIPNAD